MAVTRGKGWEVVKPKGGQINGDGRLTSGGEHTTQYAEDVSWTCTLKAYIILLTHATPIHLINKRSYIIDS